MQFICQIALKEIDFTTRAKMAYLFMTDGEDGEFDLDRSANCHRPIIG